MEERTDEQQALFVTTRVPYRMSIAQMRYVIKQISKRAGINKCIHPHQLRHSYATTLINNGAPLEVIQNLMGHEKSETTRVHAYLSGHFKTRVIQEILLKLQMQLFLFAYGGVEVGFGFLW